MRPKPWLIIGIMVVTFLSCPRTADARVDDPVELITPDPVRQTSIPDPYALSNVDELPLPKHRESFFYPDLAYRNSLEGQVLVRVLVGLRGEAERVELEASSPLFNGAALDAAHHWAFEPARLNGKPVRAWVRIPFSFRLEDDFRLRADTLWSGLLASNSVMENPDRESIDEVIRDAKEVWLFRLDPAPHDQGTVREIRSRFARRSIAEEALLKGSRRSLLRAWLADFQAPPHPPRVEGAFLPNLGVRFVAPGKRVDVLISFPDQTVFLTDGTRLWQGSALPHGVEWARLAHATFPQDPTFARYARAGIRIP